MYFGNEKTLLSTINKRIKRNVMDDFYLLSRHDLSWVVTKSQKGEFAHEIKRCYKYLKIQK